MVHEDGVDLLLGQRVIAARLARVHMPRGGRLVEQARIHEPVVDDDVGVAQEREAAHRHQAGIAGAGAHERDVARALHAAPSRSSRRRRASAT
jgi:hypothetical protein